MRRFFILAAAVGFLVVPPPATADSTVVELFTSQGCSSCPPADALLGELAARDDVVALAFHVTYWDRLGWPDPFAAPWATDRQHAYRQAMSLPYVYTPQMVIDGQREVVGSHRGEVLAALADRGRARPAGVAVRLTRPAPDRLQVSLPGQDRPLAAKVWLARYDAVNVTKVSAGENGGRRLTDVNAVRQLTDLGGWSGEARALTVPLTAGSAAGGVAVIIQASNPSGQPGAVVGAAKLEWGR
ncbi:MAG: DUF1223 domain-containing protein [Azospirillum sp.]|nr:DUF1223 domain-containing protein [Azospirillum sp.]